MGAASGPSSPHPQLAAFAAQVFPQLDKLSYYQLLRVSHTATVAQIRASYYKIAGQLHPDRYRTLANTTLRDQLETIYARINEGYRVLTNAEKRAVYDRGLTSGKWRFEATANPTPGPRNPEDLITDPQAKKFFRMGMMCLGRKDFKGAVMNFNFAKGYDAKSPVIAEKLAEAQASVAAAQKK
jgi:curved DNA-binding protein CbpA